MFAGISENANKEDGILIYFIRLFCNTLSCAINADTRNPSKIQKLLKWTMRYHCFYHCVLCTLYLKKKPDP